MKNLPLGFKIGGGFALQILISAVLGLLAVSSMNAISDNAVRLDTETTPLAAETTGLERSMLLAMFEMRGYGFTGKEDSWTRGLAQMAAAKNHLAQAGSLIESHPGLSEHTAEITAIHAKTAEYETLCASIKQTAAGMNGDLARLESQARTILKNVETYRQFQGDRLAQAASDENTNALMIRNASVKIAQITRIGDALSQIRLAFAQGRAIRDPGLIRQKLGLVDDILQNTETIIATSFLETNRTLLDEIAEVTTAYSQAVNAYLAKWEAYQADNARLDATGLALIDMVKQTNETCVTKARRIAAEDAASLRKASTATMAGLGLAVLAGAVIAWTMTRGILKPVRRGVAFAKAVAGGDLEQSLDVRQKDEIGQLSDALRTMVETLKTKIAEAGEQSRLAQAQARQAAEAQANAETARRQAEQARATGTLEAANTLQGVVEAVTAASQELSAEIGQSSSGCQEQTRLVHESVVAMEEMNATVLQVAQNASSAANNADRAREKAAEGLDVVNKAVGRITDVQTHSTRIQDNMAALGKQADGIGQVLNVITDIADQTNLLALNAAIEAARAGEAGRGFAVVADEVRKLAEKTMNATKEVDQAVGGIQHETGRYADDVKHAVTLIQEATRLADASGQSLREIVSLVDLVADEIRAIATASDEQSSASDEITKGMETINRISQETSQAMNHSARAVDELTGQAQAARNMVESMQAAGNGQAALAEGPVRPLGNTGAPALAARAAGS